MSADKTPCDSLYMLLCELYKCDDRVDELRVYIEIAQPSDILVISKYMKCVCDRNMLGGVMCVVDSVIRCMKYDGDECVCMVREVLLKCVDMVCMVRDMLCKCVWNSRSICVLYGDGVEHWVWKSGNMLMCCCMGCEMFSREWVCSMCECGMVYKEEYACDVEVFVDGFMCVYNVLCERYGVYCSRVDVDVYMCDEMLGSCSIVCDVCSMSMCDGVRMLKGMDVRGVIYNMFVLCCGDVDDVMYVRRVCDDVLCRSCVCGCVDIDVGSRVYVYVDVDELRERLLCEEDGVFWEMWERCGRKASTILYLLLVCMVDNKIVFRGMNSRVNGWVCDNVVRVLYLLCRYVRRGCVSDRLCRFVDCCMRGDVDMECVSDIGCRVGRDCMCDSMCYYGGINVRVRVYIKLLLCCCGDECVFGKMLYMLNRELYKIYCGVV